MPAGRDGERGHPDQAVAAGRVGGTRPRAGGPSIAVMQPYFVPYAGYFGLFARTDLVVLYDCVQFLRRGFQHRNRVPDRSGRPAWLTLPLARAPREVRIRDLRFRPTAWDEFTASMSRFPSLDATAFPSMRKVEDLLPRMDREPRIYIASLLQRFCDLMELPFETMWSSDLDLPPVLRGQHRVLEICRRVGARRYVNVGGGAHLYDTSLFADAGLEIEFLPPWDGSRWSVLHLLATDALPRREAFS